MYSLCEKASPKVSRILVSVISQLKNNGVEEIDAILEHLQLVSANVSSEMVIGLQSAEELEVVTEGIERFTTLGNTLLKRDDLEIDLHRFTRFQEASAFYEKTYISAMTSPLVKGFKKGGVEEATVPVGTPTDLDGNPLNPEGVEASASDLAPVPAPAGNPATLPENSLDGLPETPGVIGGVSDHLPGAYDVIGDVDDMPRTGGGVVGGVSDNLPGAYDDIGDVDDIPPVSMAPLPADQMGTAQPPSSADQADLAAAQDGDVGEMGASPLPPDMGGDPTQFDMDGLANMLAQQYREGKISMEADFMEALMNCQEANELCENLGSMEETQIYELAQKVQEMLSVSETPEVSGGEVTIQELQEAIEILASKLSESELKDL
jgi:hypothetical protein